MREQARGGKLRTAAVLALAALFFVLATGSALLGSGVYRRTAAEGTATGTRRTALAYLANQIRRADEAGGISVGVFGDSDALYLTEGDYVTCVYCFDGSLRELYAERGSGFSPEDGTALLPLGGLRIGTDDARLTFTVTDGDGASAGLILTPRCGYEVRP